MDSTYSMCLIFFVFFPFSCLHLKSFFTFPLSLLCWFGSNILVFITLVDTLEITRSILNVLNSAFIHIFIFFLQNTKVLENLTPYGRYRNVSQIFWCGAYGWLLAPATASLDPPQLCAKAMLPLRSSHAFPRMTTVRIIVSVILAQHRLLLMDKFCLRTPHWPGWNILRPVLLSGSLSTHRSFFLLSFLLWETCIVVWLFSSPFQFSSLYLSWCFL